MNILVSACLLGVNCKYNGGSNRMEKLLEQLKLVNLVPICPEQLGGLTTPRLPAEITAGGRVTNREGQDVTAQFQKGAEETFNIAKLYNCEYALLKERSPSCGSTHIYDGSFQGTTRSGEGLTAALLRKHGIQVFSEESLDELLKAIGT